ncbi:MAG: MdtA/MuxA family multidrug efflux RND transporter periplasmic adaptor subunit [Rhodospirillales bacterium]|nr:MdtA/MuxA family multidrug efflux RND transporter periplasmic adaptor subunit [Rhodospirillales bacterium]
MDAGELPGGVSGGRTEPAPKGAEHRGGPRWITICVIIVLLAAAIGVVIFLRAQKPASPSAGDRERAAVSVGVVTAIAGELALSLQALGTVTPLATVTVRTRIEGYLTRVAFREGQEVRKGDLLAEVDPRPYQAALDEALGQLASDRALLRNAEVDLDRYRGLVAEDAIARQTLDTQEALVRQYTATLQVNQAKVDSARLDVGYCRIVSPIDGRVGLRQVDAGNYVRTADTDGIVVVTQVRPINVVFTIPEDSLQAVLTRMRTGVVLPITAYDRSGTQPLATGVLATIDNQIDSTTGTVKLKGEFPNGDERLFPNQFVNVRLLLDTIRDATLVPLTAVQRGTNGAYVYVVTPDGKAAVRTVTLGPDDGEKVQILKGVAPGERVVTDGVDRLRDGSRVVIPGSVTGDGAGDHAPTPSPASGGTGGS